MTPVSALFDEADLEALDREIRAARTLLSSLLHFHRPASATRAR